MAITIFIGSYRFAIPYIRVTGVRQPFLTDTAVHPSTLAEVQYYQSSIGFWCLWSTLALENRLGKFVAKVSIIIPAFNGVSRYLEEAISSVLAQTYRDFELLVVDDASTDDTARLVLRFPQARYFIRAEDGGQAVARNDGARLAQGGVPRLPWSG